MTKPLTQKQLAAQRVDAMTKEEAGRAAACLLPKTYASDLERLGALFLACMRAGVNLYPDEDGWDGGRGPLLYATGLPHAPGAHRREAALLQQPPGHNSAG